MDKTSASINLPDSWSFYASNIAAMITLAGLDFIGAIFAKEWAKRGRMPMFIRGWLSFSVLFYVYARILKVAELSTVTIGWIIFLQVGLLLPDVMHYDVQLPRTKWIAIAIMIGLQIYLIAVPNVDATTSSTSQHAPESSSDRPSPTTGQLQDSVPPMREGKRPRRPLGPTAV